MPCHCSIHIPEHYDYVRLFWADNVITRRVHSLISIYAGIDKRKDLKFNQGDV